VMIVALGNWNLHFVENVRQVEGLVQTHLRCEQGKHVKLGAEQNSISHTTQMALPCSRHPLAHFA